MKQKVVVLGGGIAGLSAAYHLVQNGDVDVEVLERADRVGGLAASFTLGPAVFDFGPHAFHSQEPDLISFFQKLMGDGTFHEINKDVAIFFNGRFYSYPLNPIKALRNMPLKDSVRCGLSYLFNRARRGGSVRTAEDFFVRQFGPALYRIFFEGYTQKVWGIHPREISAAFIQNRLPPASLWRIAYAAITGRDIKVRKSHEVPLRLRIFYPKGGSAEFPRAMARRVEEAGGRISIGAEAVGIDLAGGRVVGVRVRQGGVDRHVPCQAVVSTVPLNDLAGLLSPAAPPEVLSAVRGLTFRPVLIACLWVAKPRLFPYQTVYYTNRIFNRLAQMNSYSPETAPTGTCAVTAEMTCVLDDEIWRMAERDLLRRVVADIEKEGLLSAADVTETMLLRTPHGYPVYRLGYEEPLRRLRDFVRGIPNLYTGGRQGMFNYAQMHYALSSGKKIAAHWKSGGPKPSLVAGETEDIFFT